MITTTTTPYNSIHIRSIGYYTEHYYYGNMYPVLQSPYCYCYGVVIVGPNTELVSVENANLQNPLPVQRRSLTCSTFISHTPGKSETRRFPRIMSKRREAFKVLGDVDRYSPLACRHSRYVLCSVRSIPYYMTVAYCTILACMPSCLFFFSLFGLQMRAVSISLFKYDHQGLLKPDKAIPVTSPVSAPNHPCPVNR